MPLLIAAASFFLYMEVLARLGRSLWWDDNYTHSLLIPAVIAFIVWRERPLLEAALQSPNFTLGLILTLMAIAMLLFGTLGAELFAQRISLVIFLAGIIVYFFGKRLLVNLWVPFTLLLLSIPLPQILFTKITFPLQLLASRIADASVRVFDISTVRNGNIIEVFPIGAAQSVTLEVVEACSGIRSMMTLAALAVLLAYFMSKQGKVKQSFGDLLTDPALWHTLLLVVISVPVAVVTNAVRLSAATAMTFYYGSGFVESVWHEISGIAVFGLAFVLLAGASRILSHILPKPRGEVTDSPDLPFTQRTPISQQRVLFLFITILTCAVAINWFGRREVEPVERLDLARFPIYLDGSVKIGEDTRFEPPVERILGANDYVLRDYRTPDGKKINLYIGYYKTQRTGKTYHSPLNCLPGSGWVMSERTPVDLEIGGDKTTRITANSYLVQRGDKRGLMVYWYQGRGRSNSSEYWDKAGTIVDSVLRNRTDGALIRVMTAVDNDEPEAVGEVVEFASIVAARLDRFVPK